ncbi:amino-acid carrier protein AlsT [Clostridium acetireducens DSM 10703]|uniref:Amino-acid carrier protein AlsT n=1 Tax=Clostridium acetireducens DSM 10703 TaxID=1121290 RepID=A0A1E8EZY3_9CLOT|nr:alanine/glycine:cation symporter family protein [Clostridium acetireducens]OFI06728.1 amino-acid carrier protein AlsT [Clostridium acetireducens DSM 10703]
MDSFLNFLNSIVSKCNDILWSYVLIAVLILAGIYFTIKSGFVQFRCIGEMFRLLGEGASNSNLEKEKPVSSFQAFCMSTASRVGTGNLAGVAIAITLGGPGAVFWMWMLALIGSASGFVESTLAQIYKIKDKHGYRGGPAYYMEKALHKRWLGVIFSILITISFGLVFNSVQANTISFAFEEAFGMSRFTVGIILAVATGIIIFGGVKRIANATSIIVPVMAVAYVILALFITIKNITAVPQVLSLIFKNAFGINQAVGGAMGTAMLMGIKRGLFSNEAGMGSAPNAAATADVTHPVKQGFIQALGVFTDTILICSCTAFIVLLSGVYTNTNLEGIKVTQAALTTQVGSWGNIFIAVAIFLFAFSSLIGNYYYGETNIEFMSKNKIWLILYRVAVCFMIFFGCIAKIQLVWDMADLFMGSMALINLVAIFKLNGIAFAALKDYLKQKKEGKDPVFTADVIPGIEGAECWEKNNIKEVV